MLLLYYVISADLFSEFHLYIHTFSIYLERKAFFSFCSLLIDRNKVKGLAMETALTTDNFMDFIPDDKHALVNAWMRLVLMIHDGEYCFFFVTNFFHWCT